MKRTTAAAVHFRIATASPTMLRFSTPVAGSRQKGPPQALKWSSLTDDLPHIYSRKSPRHIKPREQPCKRNGSILRDRTSFARRARDTKLVVVDIPGINEVVRVTSI
jgi:hypothetical protein